MAFWAAAIPAIIGAAGALLGGGQSAKATKASELRQLEAQSYYTHNQHQIEVQDLEKAGLNPILSARLGGNQATGGGSGMTYPNIIGPAASSALSAYRMASEIDQMRASTDKLIADTRKSEAETQVSDAAYTTEKRKADMIHEQTNLYEAQTRLNNTMQILQSLNIPGATNEATIEEAAGPALRGAGKMAPYLKLLNDFLKGGKK